MSQETNCKDITNKIEQISLKRDELTQSVDNNDINRALDIKKEILYIIDELERICPFTTLEKAKEILGKEYLGPEAIEKVFGKETIPVEIPPIPFTLKEIKEAAKSRDKFLILRTDQIPDHKLISPNILRATLPRSPVTRWALVTKECLKGSGNKNSIEQTEFVINYIKEYIYTNREMPFQYQEAIKEFESEKDELKESAINKQSYISLKIDKLTRRNVEEVLYDLLVYYMINKENLLNSQYDRSLDVDSGLSIVGYFDARRFGITFDGSSPTQIDNRIGACLSLTI